MTASTFQREDLMPKSADGTSRGMLFAVLVHAGLLVALTLGVNWKMSEPEGVEAELWASVPQIAAQRDIAPEPPPKPVPKVEPKPEPKPEPEPKSRPDPQIAIEKAKQEKLKKKQEEEKREREEKEKLEKKRAQEEKAKLAKAEAERQKKLDEARDKNLARIREMMGEKSGSPTSNASQTKGPSPSYAGKLRAAIYPNITFIRAVAGNPTAEVQVQAAPDGTVVGRRLIKSSGIPEWDDAVLDAITKTGKLPRDEDGSVPASITIGFRPQP